MPCLYKRLESRDRKVRGSHKNESKWFHNSLPLGKEPRRLEALLAETFALRQFAEDHIFLKARKVIYEETPV